MKIMIVYHNIPESTDVYIEDVTDSEWKWMQKTHGEYVNSDMSLANERACSKLSEWLVGKPKISMSTPVSTKLTGIEHVIITGFLM